MSLQMPILYNKTLLQVLNTHDEDIMCGLLDFLDTLLQSIIFGGATKIFLFVSF